MPGLRGWQKNPAIPVDMCVGKLDRTNLLGGHGAKDNGAGAAEVARATGDLGEWCFL